MIKLIMSDMDGTLLDENGNLPQGFEETMAELKARGVIFAPASGRQYNSLLGSFPAYKDDFIFISENGTMVKQRGEEIFSCAMPRQRALQVAREGMAYTKGYVVASGKKVSYVLKEHMVKEFTDELGIYFSHTEKLNSFDEVVDDEFIKVSFFDPEGKASQSLYPFLKRYDGPLQVVLASAYWVDVINFGINKGLAVQNIQKRLHIAPNECAAFGDYMNDAEMMSSVYYSYAMANAHPKVKELARFEAKSNAEYGVIKAINEMIEKGLCGERKA